jgi:hypothetical protein
MLPAFHKRIDHQQPICRISKPARLPLAGFQKLSAVNRSKGFELAGFYKPFRKFKGFWR